MSPTGVEAFDSTPRLAERLRVARPEDRREELAGLRDVVTSTTDTAEAAHWLSELARLRNLLRDDLDPQDGFWLEVEELSEPLRRMRAAHAVATQREADESGRVTVRDRVRASLAAPRRPVEIAEELGLHPSKVTRAIAELVEMGAAHQVEHADSDRRARYYQAAAALVVAEPKREPGRLRRIMEDFERRVRQQMAELGLQLPAGEEVPEYWDAFAAEAATTFALAASRHVHPLPTLWEFKNRPTTDGASRSGDPVELATWVAGLLSLPHEPREGAFTGKFDWPHTPIPALERTLWVADSGSRRLVLIYRFGRIEGSHPTPHKLHDPLFAQLTSAPDTALWRSVRFVIPDASGGWGVLKPGAKRHSSLLPDKDSAIERAFTIVKNAGGGVVVVPVDASEPVS
jgi:DNA-binding Lrp family transcriptional regulator